MIVLYLLIATPDEYPGGLAVESITKTSLEFSWNALDWCNQQYDLKVNKISEDGSMTLFDTVATTYTAFTVPGLSPFIYYSATVAARCNGVVSPAVVTRTNEDGE